MRLLEDALLQLVMACSVPSLPADIIQAIVLTESAGYVYALSGGHSNQQYSLLPSNAEGRNYALQVGRLSLERDINISIGLMQVNSWHIKRMGASARTVFDPCNNILIGSSILHEIVSRECSSNITSQCLNASLRQYNTGSLKPSVAGARYVQRVRSYLEASQ